jgi:hypothetical protein
MVNTDTYALDHKVGDDPVEGAPLEVQGLPGLAGPLLAGAQRPEVLDRLGDRVAEQAQNDPSSALASLDLHVKVHLVRDLLGTIPERFGSSVERENTMGVLVRSAAGMDQSSLRTIARAVRCHPRAYCILHRNHDCNDGSNQRRGNPFSCVCALPVHRTGARPPCTRDLWELRRQVEGPA